jgi:SPP1 gp7 family putative phage head morphogenesis protein
MSANDFVFDASVKHQIFVQRYAGGQVKDLLKYLTELVRDVEVKLARAESLSQAQKLSTELRDIRELIDDALRKISSGVLSNIVDFAEYEAEFAVKTISLAATVEATLPQSELLRALVTTRPMVLHSGKATQELTIDSAVRTFSQRKSAELLRVIQTGFINGDPVAVLTKRVKDVSKRQASQAESLVRTSIQHISGEARKETHIANNDILQGEEWVAVLDDRTTIGCAALDGSIFNFNEGPTTPRHWRCRSTRVPVLQEKFRVPGLEGTRASKGSDFTGQISAKRTYSGWLRDQSESFQITVLGAERQKLFKAGGLSLDKFTDDVGVQYTLDELRLLEPVAFERAGI